MLSRFSLPELAWLIEREQVLENDQVFHWFHQVQLLPLHSRLKRFFHAFTRQRLLWQRRKAYSYTVKESQ